MQEPTVLPTPPPPKRKRLNQKTSCPYLDTINRTLLDFDFEHSCSVSLEAGPHIYGCLVCGKFFLGRGKQTPAYIHSVDEEHHVYVHLSKGSFHCLPDDYEIIEPSLSDISVALNPTFSQEEIEALDAQRGLARDLFGRRYLPGFVGLNNLSKTDYVNASIQALAHVRPLRNYFLKGETKDASPLAQRFGELIRKMWSSKRFKSSIDPHTFVQAVSVASKKRFQVGKQGEAGEFIAWLLHHLHLGLGGTKKPGSSIIHKIFQGRVEVTSRQRVKKRFLTEETEEDFPLDDRVGSDDEETHENKLEQQRRSAIEADKLTMHESSQTTHFLQLTLDIPEKPLFKDEDGGLVIPQEPLVSVLQKFNGTTFHDVLSSEKNQVLKRRYRLLELPNYLILHLARFTKNTFNVEKNPTIVAFPVKNLDLNPYVHPKEEKRKIPTPEEVQSMSLKQLKKLFTKHNHHDIAQNPTLTLPTLRTLAADFLTTSLPLLLSNKYDLVANITHDIPPEVGREGTTRDPLQEGSYRCHVQHKATGQWYEMMDLHVQETMPQLIGLSESYVLIFEKKGLS